MGQGSPSQFSLSSNGPSHAGPLLVAFFSTTRVLFFTPSSPHVVEHCDHSSHCAHIQGQGCVSNISLAISNSSNSKSISSFSSSQAVLFALSMYSSSPLQTS